MTHCVLCYTAQQQPVYTGYEVTKVKKEAVMI